MLEDGTPALDALQRMRPFTGGLMSWIFNPVFYTQSGTTHRGWADYCSSGLAVLEDRFSARNHFEGWSLEHPVIVDLLYALRSYAKPADDDWFKVLLAAGSWEQATMPPSMKHPDRGVFAGFDHAVRAWNFHVTLQATRESCGRLWPLTCEELQEWMAAAPRNQGVIPGTEAALMRELHALALRRFPKEISAQ